MYINDRDQINYHGFLKALREMQGANLKQVAEGICSDSEVCRVEIGDRLPEKLMRDRITSRLGVSGEEYEEYLRPEEYRQWEIRMYILDNINKGDAEAVQKGIDLYNKIPDRNPVMEQFIDTMRYMLAQMNGASDEMLRALIELAVVHTIPDIDAAFEGSQLLADQELNLIAEYTHLREYYGDNEIEFEWRLSEYLNILDYIDNSYMDTIGRSKVYPRTTCYICEWVLENRPKKKHLELAYEICTSSIELLRDASRLYYFVELLEYQKEIITRLLKYKIDDVRRSQLQSVYERDCEWEQLFKELYSEYDVPIYMKNFTYLYVETECNNAVEVIRTRRNMLKLSRVKVCDNICTDKTIERIENYTNSPSIVIIRDLFERIGLCAEYKRARVITDNAEMLRVSNDLIACLNNFDHENMRGHLNRLKEHLHMDILYNQQEIERNENILAYREGTIDKNIFYNRIKQALECTIPIVAIVRTGKKYLTKSELSCVHDLAFNTNEDVSFRCMDIIEELCDEMLSNKINPDRVTVFEMLISRIASSRGDEGRYEESSYLSDRVLKECLKNRRMQVLADNIYNKVWNYQQKSFYLELKVDYNLVLKSLNKCIQLSSILKENNWVAFFQSKIKKVYDLINE